MRTATKRAPYVEAVGGHLFDVPWARRQEILDDLERHLRESDPEYDSAQAWTARFGPPSEYARRLRDELGLASDNVGLARGRRWHLRTATRRTKVLVGSIVVVVVLVSGAVVAAARWIATLQPFDTGNVLAMPGHEAFEAGGYSEFQWTFHAGEGFAVGTMLINDGPVAVRITDLGPWFGGGSEPGIHVPWDNWRVTLGLADDVMGPADRPFAPFTLQPGEGEWIFIHGDFVRCSEFYAVGTGAGLDAFPVTFEVFGFTRHETLDLGFTYSVQVGPECEGASDRGS